MPSYESLVRDYHALAFRIARTILRDDSAAEDAVQDVYVHFLEDPEALKSVENLRAFVARAAMNRALDLKRGAGRREIHEKAAITGRAEMNPIEAASRAELRARVAQLPDEQRVAVELHYFLGLTKEETAHAMRVASGTVSSRLNTALGNLRTALAGAAFAGLVAMLESELGKCSAEVTVPADLGTKLLKLSPRVTGRSAAPQSASSSRVARPFAATALVALLALLGVGAWKWRAANAADGGAAGGAAVAGISDGEVRRAGGAGLPETNPNPVAAGGAGTGGAASQPEQNPTVVYEGFLFRGSLGLFLKDATWEPARPRQEMLRQTEDRAYERRVVDPYFVNEEPFAGLPIATTLDFQPYLAEKAGTDGLPLARLKVAARLLPDPNGDSVRYQAVTVLEREVISVAWLNAWRELRAACEGSGEPLCLPPGLAKRTAVLKVASEFSEALAHAHAARAGEACAKWRIQREVELLQAPTRLLERVGLASTLPAVPSGEELHDLFMEATSPAGLRAAVASRWGEEAVSLEAPCYRKDDDDGSGYAWASIAISDACAMTEAEFAALRKEIDAIKENHLRMSDPLPAQWSDGAKQALAARGLELVEPDRMDREKYVLEGGAKVASVASGSAAEKAGLRVGDLVWQATGPVRSKEAVKVETEWIGSPGVLGWMLSIADEEKAETVQIGVVRDGANVTLELGR